MIAAVMNTFVAITEMEGLANLGAMAVMSVAFMVVLRWMLTRWEERALIMERRIEVNTLALLALQRTLLIHDLTVTGLNPASAGVDFEERDSRAYAKYQEILTAIAEVSSAITSEARIRRSTP